MNMREKIANMLGQIPSFIYRVQNGIRITDVIILAMFSMFLIQQYQISKISKATPEIVSVDVGKLSSYIVKDIGSYDLDNPSEIEQKQRLFLDFTKQTLKETAKLNNLIIIPSDVMIIGEIRDITDMVIHAFKKDK